ncbi:hypothetical protein AU375_02819 [Methylobacterium radiotolerans]|nr:hypothetical protein AU375_02819 [Methylobacterium radiotolerans]
MFRARAADPSPCNVARSPAIVSAGGAHTSFVRTYTGLIAAIQIIAALLLF